MARLESHHKAHIVNRLAVFETPSQVAESVQRRFGVALTRQKVESYDPTKSSGKKLSTKWRRAFTQARERYLAVMSDVTVSEKISEMVGAAVAEAASDMFAQGRSEI